MMVCSLSPRQPTSADIIGPMAEGTGIMIIRCRLYQARRSSDWLELRRVQSRCFDFDCPIRTNELLLLITTLKLKLKLSKFEVCVPHDERLPWCRH